MKILALGGTGAMGVDLVKILARRGENMTVTSRSERASEFGNVRDAWFGMTYPEDKPVVEAAIQGLIRKGLYNESLFSLI